MATPDIAPDTKDWTWVLERPCYDGVSGSQWERPGLRSNGSRFTIASPGQYHLHDVVHHLHDVQAG